MVSFNLDPSDGPHVASDLTNKELEFLQQVLAVELAIRLDSSEYQQRFRSIADHRRQMDEIVEDWRRQRERHEFVISVRADLDELPVLEDR